MQAEEILREKLWDEERNLVEMAIWCVKPSTRQPDGLRYCLVFVRSDEREPAVLYDNHHPKGHHRHVGRVEGPYDFTDVRQLIEDFQADVERARRRK